MKNEKTAMIGAGSSMFCRTLASAIIATPALADSKFALLSRTAARLKF
ncbi:MAG: hypothetical protein ACYTEQ_10195 [Planctomycetota bacterium]